MRKRFLNLLLIAVLAMGFVSCGSDDDPVMGDKSDLIGNYTGNLEVTITSVGGKTPYVKSDAVFQLKSWVQDNKKLAAYFDNDLPDGILASNFVIKEDSYSFNMDGTPTAGFTMTGNEIWSYLTDWYAIDYPEGFSKAVLKLNATTAKFDRKTNHLAFTYRGNLTLTPKNTSYGVSSHDIVFTYTALTKK